MRFDDLIRISYKQVLNQWRRNLGVVTTIALGTAGFILIISMGRNVESNIKKDLELIGRATRIQVSFGSVKTQQMTRPEYFQQATVARIRAMPGVMSAGLQAHKHATALYRQADQFRPTLLGVDEYYWDIHGFHATSGVLFGPRHVQERARVCVMGESLAQTIFGRMDIAGEYLQIDNELYRVMGVLNAVRGSTFRSDAVFIPLSTAVDRIEMLSPPNTLFIRCDGWDEVEPVADAVPGIVRQQQPAQNLEVYVARTQLRSLKRIVWTVKVFVNLAIVATLALGGFGIWNSMMTSVRSRTREIGLKKIMGAKDREIFSQFLTEAICFSLCAVSFGVLMSLGAVKLMAIAFDIHPAQNLFYLCAGMGLVFSLILGVGAGLAPAMKASRMQVVDAVRYE
ncbi:MAG: ABC transporter permease [Deltaproteobacteria bacterium]|nr:ABC transporter permease [Deltaproteobacteria bacterium]